ncbi:hypothetical protein MUO14_21585 [Halobacillus shinanisalinarum]|uniref:Uncharacterized protein n=1 Tax=Halobacillus shinanisalinarum TaxID=2932258 RepID=A0ABY4H1W2_9BACI|nr:hypothetical protein [Halobacillus shinanisalinarum]UOQ92962.1 hypothetical protein MUO14_21585 [Halobacillus shinanisalinarum]
MAWIQHFTWLSPLLLIIFVLSLFWSFRAFKQKAYPMIIIAGMLHLVISPFFAYSFGPFMFGIGIVELYMGAINKKKARAVRL